MAATAHATQLHIINTATKQELKLEKRDIPVSVNGSVVIGDFYKDPINHGFSVLIVKRRMDLESIDHLREAQ